MRSLTLPALAAALTLTLAACGDSFSPTVDNVSGTYGAATFTTTSPALTTNLLAAGATVTLTLAPDGTTTGRLFVPGAVLGGGDLDEDLTGTWTLAGNKVTFSQTADTFIREVQFTATQNRLSGEQTFSGVTVRLVLTRTG